MAGGTGTRLANQRAASGVGACGSPPPPDAESLVDARPRWCRGWGWAIRCRQAPKPGVASHPQPGGPLLKCQSPSPNTLPCTSPASWRPTGRLSPYFTDG